MMKDAYNKTREFMAYTICVAILSEEEAKSIKAECKDTSHPRHEAARILYADYLHAADAIIKILPELER